MVDYFRCGYCGHVWTLPKAQLDTTRLAVMAAASSAR